MAHLPISNDSLSMFFNPFNRLECLGFVGHGKSGWSFEYNCRNFIDHRMFAGGPDQDTLSLGDFLHTRRRWRRWILLDAPHSTADQCYQLVNRFQLCYRRRRNLSENNARREAVEVCGKSIFHSLRLHRRRRQTWRRSLDFRKQKQRQWVDEPSEWSFWLSKKFICSTCRLQTFQYFRHRELDGRWSKTLNIWWSFAIEKSFTRFSAAATTTSKIRASSSHAARLRVEILIITTNMLKNTRRNKCSSVFNKTFYWFFFLFTCF